MKINPYLLELISEEEINILVSFYGTDLYKNYYKRLVNKYTKFYKILANYDFSDEDHSA